MTANVQASILSPELALVDPDAAEWARATLPPPLDTIARLEERARGRALAVATSAPPRPLPSSVRAPYARPAPVAARRRRGRGRLGAALFAAGVAGVAAVSLLVGVRVDVKGEPAGAVSTEAASPLPKPVQKGNAKRPSTASTKRGRATAPGRAKVQASARRRFAWAPTAGASGYHVEFFRGGERVFSGDTAGTTIDIPVRWRYRGVAHAFQSGDYRWYVWPEFDGRRSAHASVQTTISISAR
jgi:hypothetical protein